jgi:oligopeptide transport system substrate-binding protein
MNCRIILALSLCFALYTQTAFTQIDATSVDLKNQKITIALAQEPPQMNPLKATDQVSFFILGHIAEGLLRYDRRGRLTPGVAEEWEMDEQGATFRLRKNARWSDGLPVTAHDFVFAWREAVAPTTASEYAFVLFPVKNGEQINMGALDKSELGVTAIDDHTLKVEFERPCAYFLKLTAFGTYFPVRQDFYENRGERYAADVDDMLYNGPFRLSEWVHSASLKMVKNENYWNKEAITLTEIDAAYITTDTTARLNLFKDGKIAMTGLDSETIKDALNQKYRIRKFTTGSVFYLEYNFREGRLSANRNLRKAMQRVFDPNELVNKVLATPGNLPGYSLFPVWLDGVKGKFRKEFPAKRISVDIDAGRRLLALAKKELNLDQIPPLILLVGDSPTAAKQAEYLQGLFKSTLDLDLKIDIQTFKQRLAKMTAGDFDMVSAGWGPDFNDIMTFGDLMASWNLNNRGRYNNPRYDWLVRQAQNSTDPRVRMEAMAEVQDIIIDDVVILPEYEQGIVYLQHPKLKGVVRRVVGQDPDYTYARVVP